MVYSRVIFKRFDGKSLQYIEFFNLSVEPWQPNLTTLVNFDAKWKDMLEKNTPIPTPIEKKYEDKAGVFEGGGYVEKGVYRPAVDCTMKSPAAKGSQR